MLKRALIYGGLIVLAGAAWTMIEFSLGWHTADVDPNRPTGYVPLLFPVIGIVLAIRAAKHDQTGAFSFGDGFKQGLAVAAVAAVLGAVFAYLYGAVINPEFGERLVEATRADLERRNFGAREIESALAPARAMSSPPAQALASAFGSVLIGLVISAVAAAIMRRKEAPVDDGYGGQGV